MRGIHWLAGVLICMVVGLAAYVAGTLARPQTEPELRTESDAHQASPSSAEPTAILNSTRIEELERAIEALRADFEQSRISRAPAVLSDEERIDAIVAARLARSRQDTVAKESRVLASRKIGYLLGSYPELKENPEPFVEIVARYYRDLRGLFEDLDGVRQVPMRGTPEYAAWQSRWDAIRQRAKGELATLMPTPNADSLLSFLTPAEYQRNQ